jgi:hypothetical protein
METPSDHSMPPRISFLGGVADERLHGIALTEFHALERLYGPPTYSHLIIKTPETDHANACQVSLYLMMPHHIDVHVDVPDHIDQWSADPKGAIVEAFHNARGAIAERLGHPHGKRHTPSR